MPGGAAFSFDPQGMSTEATLDLARGLLVDIKAQMGTLLTQTDGLEGQLATLDASTTTQTTTLHNDLVVLQGLVDGLEGSIGTTADLSTASTVIGLLKYVKGQFDITLSGLRDGLRGASSRDLTTVQAAIEASTTAVNAASTAIVAAVGAVKTSVDAFKAAFDARDLATETTLTAAKALAHADSVAEQSAIAAAQTAITGSVDTFHSHFDARDLASQTTLEAVRAAVDGVEGLLTSIRDNTDTLEVNTDGLEALAGLTNTAIAALQSDLDSRLGEVQASPTANTVLDRLKAIKTSIDSFSASVGSGLATETTLAAFKAANHSDLLALKASVDAYKTAFDVRDLATETTQAAAKAEAHSDSLASKSSIDAMKTSVDGIRSDVAARDLATETTQLAAKTQAHGDALVEQASLASIDGKVATETTLADARTRISDLQTQLSDLRDRIGTVSASPTANTVQDRLKGIKATMDAVAVSLSSIDTDFDIALSTRASEATLSALKTRADLLATESTLALLKARADLLATEATLAAFRTEMAAAMTAANSSLDAIEASASVLDDWDESDRAKVNPIVGQAGVEAASGVVTAKTQRVVLATDVPLPAGTNALGTVISRPYDKELNGYGAITGFRSQVVNEFSRCLSYDFGGQTVLDVTAWTAALSLGASIAVGGGYASIASGTNAAGSYSLQSTSFSFFDAGHELVWNGGVRSDAGVANNVRRWGPHSVNSGFFFEWSGATFRIVTRKSGVDTPVANGSFNGNLGATYALDNAPHLFSVVWRGGSTAFFIDGTLLHKVSTTASAVTLTDTFDLPMRYSNVNSGNTTNVLLDIRGQSINRTGITHPRVSEYNSSVTPLAANGQFPGTYEDLTIFSELSILVNSDVDGSGFIRWSDDGVTAKYSDIFDYSAAGGGLSLDFPRRARFGKVEYNNGATVQGSFALHTVTSNNPNAEVTAQLMAALPGTATGSVSKSATMAQYPTQVVVVAGANAAAAAATSNTVNVPGGTLNGDLLVMTVLVAGGAAITTPTGWTLIQTTVQGSSLTQAMYRRFALSEPASYTVSWDISRKSSLNMVAFRNVDRTNPVYGFGGTGAGSGTNITFPTVSYLAGSIVAGFWGIDNTSTITKPTGWTEISTISSNEASETSYILQTTAGATGTVTATASSGAANIGQSISLRPINSLQNVGQDLRNHLLVSMFQSKPEASNIKNGFSRVNGATVLTVPAGATWKGSLAVSMSVANGAGANNPAVTGLAGMTWVPGTGGTAAETAIEAGATAAQTLLSAVVGTTAANSKSLSDVVYYAGTTAGTLVAFGTSVAAFSVEAKGVIS